MTTLVQLIRDEVKACTCGALCPNCLEGAFDETRAEGMKRAAEIAEACCKEFPACGVAVSAILANIDEKVTPSSGNVFADIGFTAEDYAASLKEIDTLRAERDGWQAKCQKLWDEADKPFNDLLHANLKVAKQGAKLEKVRKWLKEMDAHRLYMPESLAYLELKGIALTALKEIDK
jgi:hypothetical protein